MNKHISGLVLAITIAIAPLSSARAGTMVSANVSYSPNSQHIDVRATVASADPLATTGVYQTTITAVALQ